MNTKIEKIDRLSQEELKNCLVNLIKRLGYADIEIVENNIQSTLIRPLGIDKHIFILIDEKLTGNVDYDVIAEGIVEIQRKFKANSYYIVSKNNISKGFKSKISVLINTQTISFIGRDELINLIDEKYEDFWKHEDLCLIEYEKLYSTTITQDSDIKKLKIFNDKYQKLLDIFIEPRIYYTYEDKKSKTPVRKKIDIEFLLSDLDNEIITGDAGTGKTTLLKKIGEELIKSNSSNNKRNLPIFLSTTEIYENDFDIADLIERKISEHFEINDSFYKSYKIVLLIDSIDELEKNIQKRILKDLISLTKSKNIKFVLASRNSERLMSSITKNGIKIFQLDKFNNDQIKKFISRFFLSDSNKADELVDALKENRIIERMPITPLTLSLISILYEENNLEIPATIADIYDNFNSLIIGRATATSRIEFIDISFKERILSLYALHVLEKKNNTPLTQNEFIEYFSNYFKGKTLPIKKGTLEDVLQYLIEHTGILIIKENKWIKFSHDSYLEYYAALEIFKHQREKEVLLSQNFLKHNWQNTAIFYAGKSKDLPNFLENILETLKKANTLQDSFMGVLGAGYILQALYQTDNVLRKKVVLQALDLSINTYETTTKLASDNSALFKNYNIPILQLLNLFYFYENFNSLTVKDPLVLAFKEILEKYRIDKKNVDAYKAIKLALTLDSRRINYSEPLGLVLEEKEIFKDPSFYVLLDFSLNIFGKEKYKSIKNDLKKDYLHKISKPVQKLINLPASRLRFSNLDSIEADRDVKIIVEGQTDAEIIEHAYYCLTNGSLPYWSISRAGNLSGGATEVAKSLSSVKPVLNENNFVIGIFDHDAKGLQEFRGLKDNIFNSEIKDTIKRHITHNIYAICIPVPGDLDYYLYKEQEYNQFEIEHYFDIELLKKLKIAEPCPISDNIYKIKDSKKKSFSKHIRTIHKASTFRYFIHLFDHIDKITGRQIEYDY
jgi:nucleoside-triphosphatase THEP1